MTSSLPNFDRSALTMIAQGAEKIFENAERLYREAELLAKAGAIERALFLHQISLEECSKIESLGAWATTLLAGYDVNAKTMLDSFSRHKSKNKANAYMLEGSPAERSAKERGDWKSALAEFKKLQSEFHEKSNNAKNASLYVDWVEEKFVAPRERIDAQMLQDIIGRNEQFLGYAHNGLRMLQRLERAPEEMQGIIVDFVRTAETMRSEKPDTVMAAIDELIRKFIDDERGKRTS